MDIWSSRLLSIGFPLHPFAIWKKNGRAQTQLSPPPHTFAVEQGFNLFGLYCLFKGGGRVKCSFFSYARSCSAQHATNPPLASTHQYFTTQRCYTHTARLVVVTVVSTLDT